MSKTRWGSICSVQMPNALTTVQKHDRVVLVAQWHSYLVPNRWNGPEFSDVERRQALRKTVDKLLQMNKTVLILGQVVQFPKIRVDCPLKLPMSPGATDLPCFEAVKAEESKENVFLKSLASSCNVFYWDPNDEICEGSRCLAYHNKTRKYYDSTHLSHYLILVGSISGKRFQSAFTGVVRGKLRGF